MFISETEICTTSGDTYKFGQEFAAHYAKDPERAIRSLGILSKGDLEIAHKIIETMNPGLLVGGCQDEPCDDLEID